MNAQPRFKTTHEQPPPVNDEDVRFTLSEEVLIGVVGAVGWLASLPVRAAVGSAATVAHVAKSIVTR